MVFTSLNPPRDSPHEDAIAWPLRVRPVVDPEAFEKQPKDDLRQIAAPVGRHTHLNLRR
jgi:hypothetical protein